MCKDISSTMSVPEAGPHTPCTRLSAPWTPSSRRQHLPTPTATSSLWTDGAPTWAAPSPTERHPDRTIPPSGTKRPVRGRRKPRRLHRKSRNRNPAETPHSGIRNATPQRPGCHTSARPKCGIPPREVWHSTPRSVASEGVRPFMYNHLPDKRAKRQKREDKYVLLSNKTNPI